MQFLGIVRAFGVTCQPAPLSSKPPRSRSSLQDRRNNTPIFITGVNDTRGFLAWLWATCRSSLTAEVKTECLVLVPESADGFRATVVDSGLSMLVEVCLSTPFRCRRIAV